MLQRINATNIFVTRVKNNTVHQTAQDTNLQEDKVTDKIIILSGNKAEKTAINQQNKEDENKTIQIITNQLTWSARTIADLYKKRWDIELFFKALKQNLQVKTFISTSENAVKSQIYVALTCYLILELIKRTIAKSVGAFSNFVEKIRICPPFYLTLDYVCNQINEKSKKIKRQKQAQLAPKGNLFSQ